jgi:tetratricopeptide (TPR) repeat protein/tRNA A-37 threonylcarbamoyl transferase component Bud32
LATPTNPVEAATAHPPVIPGYEVFGVLGHGGMGVVYKARQRDLQRTVALKMILAGVHARPEEQARFRREAETIARLQHPHIVQIYQVGEHHGQPFCALEFIDGGSLARKLGGKPQPAQPAAQLVETLARTMHAAHQQGIIHRDLKPANVLLTADGAPKITDFGLAKQIDDESWKTHSGVIVGTPPYMAPEQAGGKRRDIGPHTDVYALGAVLYEMLTGRPPFLAATQMETLDQVRHQEPVPPSRLQPKVPRDLETICLKCLEKDRQRRYGSALALAEDLHRFLANEPIQARPVRLWERGWKWAKRRPALAALIAVSAVALLSSVAWGLLYLRLQARDAEVRAGNLQRQLQEEAELTKQREQVQQLIRSGQNAADNQEWDKLQIYLESLEGKVELYEPSPQELGELEQLKGRRRAHDQYQEFMRQRDDALFHATLATGESESANLQATQDAVEKALGLLGVNIAARAPLTLAPSFTESEKVNILAGCYELLLILAQTKALRPEQKLQDQLSLALRILDRAASLGYRNHPTHAYHLRRARYLEQLGNEEEARKERQQANTQPPATALDYYLVGDEHYKQGKMLEAIGDFESALGRQPDHFWARYFLALSYLRLQPPRPDLAKAPLNACIDQRRNFPWPYLVRGFAHTKLKDFPAAKADFDEAYRLLQLQPSKNGFHVLYANRGVLWFEQQRFDEALADLQEAIKLNPHEYQAYVSLAQVYQKQRKWDEARKQLDSAIKLEPGLAVLYRFRAQLPLERPDPNLDAALADYGEAIRLDAATNDRKALAKDYAERGRILHRAQRYQEAVTAYDAALKADPSYANAYLWRAQAQLQLQKYPQAGDSLDQYVTQGGKPVVEVYRLRGFAQAQLRQYREAIEDFTRALAMQPHDPSTRAARGWAYLAMEDYRLALPDFEEATRLNPENGTFPASVASTVDMVSPLAQGPALAVFALVSWRNGDAYTGRGYARVNLGEYRRAVEDAEMTLKRGPQSPRLLYDAARIYAQATDKVQTDPRQSNPQPMASTYQERAVMLIRQSLESRPAKERGPFWRDTILLDRALSPIRGSTAFLSLASQYSQWAK